MRIAVKQLNSPDPGTLDVAIVQTTLLDLNGGELSYCGQNTLTTNTPTQFMAIVHYAAGPFGSCSTAGKLRIRWGVTEYLGPTRPYHAQSGQGEMTFAIATNAPAAGNVTSNTNIGAVVATQVVTGGTVIVTLTVTPGAATPTGQYFTFNININSSLPQAGNSYSITFGWVLEINGDGGWEVNIP